MTQVQIAKIQLLTRYVGNKFIDASFRKVGSTSMIAVYAKGEAVYLGSYTVYESGQYSWNGTIDCVCDPAFISLDIPYS